MRGLFQWLRDVPHLFAKVTVVYCVAFGSLSSLWAPVSYTHLTLPTKA